MTEVIWKIWISLELLLNTIILKKVLRVLFLYIHVKSLLKLIEFKEKNRLSLIPKMPLIDLLWCWRNTTTKFINILKEPTKWFVKSVYTRITKNSTNAFCWNFNEQKFCVFSCFFLPSFTWTQKVPRNLTFLFCINTEIAFTSKVLCCWCCYYFGCCRYFLCFF